MKLKLKLELGLDWGMWGCEPPEKARRNRRRCMQAADTLKTVEIAMRNVEIAPEFNFITYKTQHWSSGRLTMT